MEPANFYFLILPLAVLIVILVSVVLYLATKQEESLYDKEMKKLRIILKSGSMDKKTFERMRNRIKQEIIFAEELERLYALLHDGKIDRDTYMQLRELLEKTFRQRLKGVIA